MQPRDLLSLLGAAALIFVTILIVRWRRRDYERNTTHLATEYVCEHLRPALEKIMSQGHRITRIGQRHRDLPFEIHVEPPFDPAALLAELDLKEPVFLSERQVLYCKEDWCELHPQP